MTKSATDLLKSIKNRASLPDLSDERWSNTNIIDAVNEVMAEKVTPYIARLAEEYLIQKQVIQLTVSDVHQFPQLLIPIPERSYGRTIRELKYRKTDGTLINIPQISLNDEDMVGAGKGNSANFPRIFGFHFLNDAIKIIGVEAKDFNEQLEIHYILKPSTLVNRTTEFLPLQTITYSSVTRKMTFGSMVMASFTEFATYVPLNAERLFDVYRRSTGAILMPNLKLTRDAVGIALISDADALSDADRLTLIAYQLGGFPANGTTYAQDICLVPAGTCQFTTIPEEVDNMLVLEVCGRILESFSDTEGLKINEKRLQATDDSLTSAFGNRIKGESKIITNRRGLLSSLRSRRYY